MTDYLTSFSNSIDFIEDHLKTPVTVPVIATQAANYSVYHYVRLFRLLTGETPGSYLRKRRLTEAAQEILASQRAIVEIAVEYQFQSHAAFSRSFSSHFGIPPSELRRHRPFLHLTPRAVIAPDAAHAPATNSPQIVTRPALLLAGLAYHGDNRGGELAEIWQRLMQQVGGISAQVQPRQTYGLWRYPDNYQTTRDFDYWAAVVVTQCAGLPPGVACASLKPNNYAVFEHRGPLVQIRRTYLDIYGEWLPQSGYRPAGNYDLEYYDERFTGVDREDSILNILVPVKQA